MQDNESDNAMRRKHPRHHLREPVQVYDRMADRELGLLANISLDGIMVASQNEIDTDTLYQVSLIFPESINGINSINVGVDCMWCSANTENANLFWSGFHIIGYDDDEVSILEQLINKLAKD